MALKFLDGFEQYPSGINFSNTTNSPIILSYSSTNSYKWSNLLMSGSTVNCSNTVYRTAQTNAKSLYIGGGGDMIHFSFPQNVTHIIGFGYKISTLSATYGECSLLNFYDTMSYGTLLGFRVGISSSGVIRVGYGNTSLYNIQTVLASSTSPVISPGTWYFIEMKISFSASAGNFELRVNGNSVIQLTNANTLGGATSSAGFTITSGVDTYGAAYIDDLYVCDTTGTTNNDFLGPLSVYTLFPNGAGSATDFTVTGAASNYLAVNTDSQTTTTYVESNTTNAKNLYQVGDLPITATTIPGVMLMSTTQKGDNGARNQQLLIKTSGTEAASGDLTSTYGSWVRATAIFEKQADGTTAWDTTAVNSMEIGHKNT